MITQARNEIIESNDELSYKVLFLFLFYKILCVSILPIKNNFFIDFFFIANFFLLSLDFNNLLNIKLRFRNFFQFLTVLFFFSLIFSVFIVNFNLNNDLTSISKTIIIIFQFILFFFFLGNKVFKSNEFFNNFLNGIFVFSIISTLFTLFNYQTQLIYSERYSYATLGFYSHPNTAAFVFSFAFPVLIYKYYNKEISLYPFVILTVIFSISLLLTFSRAGYLAVGISSMLFVYTRSKKAFFLLLVFCILITFTFLLNINTAKSGSSFSRIQLLLTGINMIIENPRNFLWGVGVENSLKLFEQQKIIFGNVEENILTPHNSVIFAIMQFGIFPISTYLFLFFGILISARRYIKKNIQNDNLKVMLCVAIVISVFVQNIFEDTLLNPEFPIMMMNLIFMGYLYYFISKESESIRV